MYKQIKCLWEAIYNLKRRVKVLENGDVGGSGTSVLFGGGEPITPPENENSIYFDINNWNLYEWDQVNGTWGLRIDGTSIFGTTLSDPVDLNTPPAFGESPVYLNVDNGTIWYWDGTIWKSFASGVGINEVLAIGNIAIDKNIEFQATGGGANRHTFVSVDGISTNIDDYESGGGVNVNGLVVYSNKKEGLFSGISNPLSDNRLYTIPDKSGTLALLDDVDSLLGTDIVFIGCSNTGSSGGDYKNKIFKSVADFDAAGSSKWFSKNGADIIDICNRVKVGNIVIITNDDSSFTFSVADGLIVNKQLRFFLRSSTSPIKASESNAITLINSSISAYPGSSELRLQCDYNNVCINLKNSQVCDIEYLSGSVNNTVGYITGINSQITAKYLSFGNSNRSFFGILYNCFIKITGGITLSSWTGLNLIASYAQSYFDFNNGSIIWLAPYTDTTNQLNINAPFKVIVGETEYTQVPNRNSTNDSGIKNIINAAKPFRLDNIQVITPDVNLGLNSNGEIGKFTPPVTFNKNTIYIVIDPVNGSETFSTEKLLESESAAFALTPTSNNSFKSLDSIFTILNNINPNEIVFVGKNSSNVNRIKFNNLNNNLILSNITLRNPRTGNALNYFECNANLVFKNCNFTSYGNWYNGIGTNGEIILDSSYFNISSFQNVSNVIIRSIKNSTIICSTIYFSQNNSFFLNDYHDSSIPETYNSKSYIYFEYCNGGSGSYSNSFILTSNYKHKTLELICLFDNINDNTNYYMGFRPNYKFERLGRLYIGRNYFNDFNEKDYAFIIKKAKPFLFEDLQTDTPVKTLGLNTNGELMQFETSSYSSSNYNEEELTLIGDDITGYVVTRKLIETPILVKRYDVFLNGVLLAKSMITITGNSLEVDLTSYAIMPQINDILIVKYEY